MIGVDRTTVTQPPDLVDPGSKGDEERREAAVHFGPPADGAEPRIDGFPFKAYKSKGVKKALTKLFHGKCAYCESRYAHTAPMDVEHFRPKGGVKVGKTIRKPGYWWLAAEWENLLPSCIDCNRSGKRSLFPLDGVDESTFALPTRDSVADEKPLLLEPCSDDPERLFAIVDEGVTRPRHGLDESATRRVETSIEVFGLNRPALIQARGEKLRRVLLQAERVRAATLASRRSPTSETRRAVLARELDELKAMDDPRRPYTAVARTVVVPVLDKMPKALKGLWTDRPSTIDDAEVVDEFIARYRQDASLAELEERSNEDELRIDVRGLTPGQREIVETVAEAKVRELRAPPG